jgi:hypothetical protein
MNVDCFGVFPPGTSLLALPSWREPRLLLPKSGGPARRWRNSAFYPATRPMAKVYRLALRGRAAIGWGQARRAGGSPWTLREFVADCLPAADSIVLQIRAPKHAPSQIQKYTIELRDRAGTIIGYLKYAVDILPSRRLEQEHEMLTRLPAGLGPIPLRFGKMGNGTALLVTPLRGRSVFTRLPPAADVVEFAKSLEVSRSLALADHPYVRAMQERVGTLLDAIFEELSGRTWPLAFQHGDLVPWNIRARQDGKGLSAFDWEHGTAMGFPHLDLAYFILQLAALIYRWPPVKSAIYGARWLEAQPTFRFSGREARALVRLSMFDAYCRTQDDGFADDHPLQPWRRRIWQEPW